MKNVDSNILLFNLVVLKLLFFRPLIQEECLELVLGTNQSHFVQIPEDIFLCTDGSNEDRGI